MRALSLPQCVVGLTLLLAAGVPVSVARAESSPEALRQLATAHEHGEGVAKNPEEALRLYCQAARMGDALAQYNLGWMYANGRGVERNDQVAAYFFQTAAEQGLPQAQQMLGLVGGPTQEVPACLRPAPIASAEVPHEAVPKAPLPINYDKVAPKRIIELVKKLAPKYQVDTQLALAIIAAESNFNAEAVSPKNAQGLMQLIPATSERFRVKNAFDPADNIKGGLSYLRWLLAYFEGNVALVAAAYNAGEGKVERYRGIPPYKETRQYVGKILRAVGNASHPFDSKVTRPSPRLKDVTITQPWAKEAKSLGFNSP